MQEYASLLWIAAIALIFWLLVIRPAQRRQKTVQQMQSGLAVGNEVVLTSGVFGTIVEIADDHLGVEVAAGVTLRVVRGAIGSVVVRDEPAADADPATDADDTASGPDQGEN